MNNLVEGTLLVILGLTPPSVTSQRSEFELVCVSCFVVLRGNYHPLIMCLGSYNVNSKKFPHRWTEIILRFWFHRWATFCPCVQWPNKKRKSYWQQGREDSNLQALGGSHRQWDEAARSYPCLFMCRFGARNGAARASGVSGRLIGAIKEAGLRASSSACNTPRHRPRRSTCYVPPPARIIVSTMHVSNRCTRSHTGLVHSITSIRWRWSLLAMHI